MATVLCPTLYSLSSWQGSLSSVSHSAQSPSMWQGSLSAVSHSMQHVKEARCCVPLCTACQGCRAVSVLCPTMHTACQGGRAVSLLCPTPYSLSRRQGSVSAVLLSIQPIKEVRLFHCCVPLLYSLSKRQAVSLLCHLCTAFQGGRADSLLCLTLYSLSRR